MIKGTNKQIIEVLETGNAYYERAILIVRPEHYNSSKTLLDREALNLVQNMQAPSFMKKKKPIAYWAFRLGLSAIAGGMFTFALINLF